MFKRVTIIFENTVISLIYYFLFLFTPLFLFTQFYGNSNAMPNYNKIPVWNNVHGIIYVYIKYWLFAKYFKYLLSTNTVYITCLHTYSTFVLKHFRYLLATNNFDTWFFSYFREHLYNISSVHAELLLSCQGKERAVYGPVNVHDVISKE